MALEVPPFGSAAECSTRFLKVSKSQTASSQAASPQQGSLGSVALPLFPLQSPRLFEPLTSVTQTNG